jgi:hypothetical protein
LGFGGVVFGVQLMAKRRKRKRSLGIGRDLSRATRRTTKGVGISEANSSAFLALMVKMPIVVTLMMVQFMGAVAIASVELVGAAVKGTIEAYHSRKKRSGNS